jgi:hypothetical protein
MPVPKARPPHDLLLPPTWCASAWPARCAATPAPAHRRWRRGDQLDYAGQPAGYASQPGEVVNYVENHDNHTLWDHQRT